jgi:hypothetical protein
LEQREPQHTSLEARIAAMVEPSLVHMGYELVRVAIVGKDRPTVQIMVDRADGAAVSIDDCELLGRHFNAMMNVEDPIPGAWTLEISSPGTGSRATPPAPKSSPRSTAASVSMASCLAPTRPPPASAWTMGLKSPCL